VTRITAPWLTSPDTARLFDLFTQHGFQLLCVGGCVRNSLFGVPVSDIDMASDARPDDVIRMAEAAQLRVIPTGIDHGTVTVISGGTSYEITTFRSDVDTDGRHATVAFSNDHIEDAKRRDFTFNALYVGRDGTVLDPVQGLPDIAARQVRFIGDAQARITEDTLRILRFFRFFAWYGDPDGGIDPEGLAACAQGAEGLEGLSAERIGTEMIKLLSAPDPSRAIAAMQASGVLARVMPGADEPRTRRPQQQRRPVRDCLQARREPCARRGADAGREPATAPCRRPGSHALKSRIGHLPREGRRPYAHATRPSAWRTPERAGSPLDRLRLHPHQSRLA